MTAADWFVDAECRGLNPDMFHPGRGDHHTIDEARTVCADCPVARRCLARPRCRGVRATSRPERERRTLRKTLQRQGVLIHQRCHVCRHTYTPTKVGAGNYTEHLCPRCRYQAARAAGWGHKLERPA